MKVTELMTEHAVCIGPEETLEKAALSMRNDNLGFLPICKADRLVGVLTDRDIVIRSIAAGKDPRKTPVEAVMTRGVVCCMADDLVAEVEKKMKNHHIRRVVVLDKQHRAVGVLSTDDIAIKSGSGKRPAEHANRNK